MSPMRIMLARCIWTGRMSLIPFPNDCLLPNTKTAKTDGQVVNIGREFPKGQRAKADNQRFLFHTP